MEKKGYRSFRQMKSKREEKIHALEMKGGINVRNKLQRRR